MHMNSRANQQELTWYFRETHDNINFISTEIIALKYRVSNTANSTGLIKASPASTSQMTESSFCLETLHQTSSSISLFFLQNFNENLIFLRTMRCYCYCDMPRASIAGSCRSQQVSIYVEHFILT